jgi:internalin A
VLIAVIGKLWAMVSDMEGRRRLDNPEDFVRLEIATALKRGIWVIPVLLDGASMPRPSELPDDLKPFIRRQALEVSHDRFEADSERLINAIERAFESAAEQHIRMAAESRALALDLSNLHLSSLDDSIGRLNQLRTLEISGNRLSAVPASIGQLTALLELNFSRSTEVTNLSSLANLTALSKLDLSGCGRLQDLFPLSSLISLQELNLSGCGQLQDLSPLSSLTSLQELNLSGCGQLQGLSSLSRLVSLRKLDLAGCWQLQGLSSLSSLTSLKELNLAECGQLQGLSSLSNLSSLHVLDLTECVGIRRFSPLRPLLSTLQTLVLWDCQFDDLPHEVCGDAKGENVVSKVRAHFADLVSGEYRDAEVKVLFLGNGGTGKSQLCRRLRRQKFDQHVPTTHGIQLSEMILELEGFERFVRLNLWDFGGQEVYHGSHALFLQGQAVFLILWMFKLEQGSDSEADLTFRRRPLAYWLDYLRAFAAVDCPVLLIQSQCDTPAQRAPQPQMSVDDFKVLQWMRVSAKTGLGLGLLTEALREAVRDYLYYHPPPLIGAGRIGVRDRLRRLLTRDQKLPATKRQHQLLERKEFDSLCDEVGGISDKEALLNFLHDNGVIFYRAGLLADYIVLDQNWALQAIYSLFDRKKTLPLLRGYGRFSRADLETLIWSGYTSEQQKVFLGMMESCGICFRARSLSTGEWEYLAPELLPEWSGVQDLLLGRLRDDSPTAEAEARYAFLHEGILRSYLSKLGDHAKDVPVYWKYGCWFYENTTKSQVLVEGRWDDAASETGPGMIRFRAWGDRARQLIEPLLTELQRLPVGQRPEIAWPKGGPAAGPAFRASGADGARENGLTALTIVDRPKQSDQGLPKVFISYAWGDDGSTEGRQRSQLVERVCEVVQSEGWQVVRDKNSMRYGDLISVFMKTLSQADLVVVVLSAKYLHSPYCMAELHGIYQRSLGEKEDFLRHIIPLTLSDAQIGTWRYRRTRQVLGGRVSGDGAVLQVSQQSGSPAL